jgi:hypothetical protein
MMRGPLIVSEFDTTIVVPPDFEVMRDEWFNVILAQATNAAGASDRSRAPDSLATTV